MTPWGDKGIKGSLPNCHKKKKKSFDILSNYCFSFLFQRNPSPSEVVQWSNHRVMEWLRSVDLAEFAPNLRGSGVHGGLIVSSEQTDFFLWTCLETCRDQILSLCTRTDPGTPLQLRDSGAAVKYSSPEDSVTASPRHSLLCPGGTSGGAREEGVCQRHRSRTPHHHRQS